MEVVGRAKGRPARRAAGGWSRGGGPSRTAGDLGLGHLPRAFGPEPWPVMVLATVPGLAKALSPPPAEYARKGETQKVCRDLKQ